MRHFLRIFAIVTIVQTSSFLANAQGPLETTENVYLSYTNPNTRAEFLNKLLVAWRNMLNEFQATDVQITFISEQQNVGTMPADLGGNPANKVTYKITATTVLPADLERVRKSFQDEVMAAHMGPIAFSLDGVNAEAGVTAAGEGEAATTAVTTETVTVEEAVTAASAESIPVDITETVYLSYPDSGTRNEYLQKLLVVWRNVLTQYQVANLQITFVSEETNTGTMSTELGGQTANKVTYHLTGSTSQSFDLETVRQTFQTTVMNAHMGPVTFSESDLTGSASVQQETEVTTTETMSVMEETATQEGARVPVTGNRPASSVQGTNKPFTYDAMPIFMKYTTTAQRDELLNQLLTAWKMLFMQQQSSVTLSTLTITFLRDSSTTSGFHKVTYRISGSSKGESTSYFSRLDTLVRGYLGENSVSNIVSELPEKTTTTNTESLVINGGKGNGGSAMQQTTTRSSVPVWVNRQKPAAVGNNQGFGQSQVQSVSGSVNQYTTGNQQVQITASNDWQVNQQMNQLLSVWKTVLTQYQVTDVSFKIVSKTPTTTSSGSTAYTITYVITGKTSRPQTAIPQNTVTTQFQNNLQNARLSNIIIIGAGGSSVATNDQTGNGGMVKNTNVNVGQNNNQNRGGFVGVVSQNQGFGGQMEVQETTTERLVGTAENGLSSTEFQFTGPLLMTYGSSQERDKLLNQILVIWQNIFVNYGISSDDVHIRLANEMPTQYGWQTNQVTITITAPMTGTFTSQDVNSAFLNKIKEGAVTSVTTVPLGMGWNNRQANSKTKVDWTLGAQGKSDVPDTNENIILQTSILLPYSNKVQLDAAVSYIRQLYAFILGVKVGDITISVVSDTIFDDYMGTSKIHNLTYSVTVAPSAALRLNLNDVASKFDQLLGSTVESFRSTVNPSPVRLVDPSRGNRISVKRGHNHGGMGSGVGDNDEESENQMKSFLVYGSIDATYKTRRERREIVDRLRRVWEDAIGHNGAIVDMSVHRDIQRNDGSRRLYYVVTIVGDNDRYNMRDLKRNFLAALIRSKIPLVRIPSANDPQPDINPPRESDYGGKAYGLYDTIVVKYKNSRDYDAFLEALRRAWQTVLGQSVSDVEITVNSKRDGPRRNTYLISYTITFSSSDSNLDLDDLTTQFKNNVVSIRGPGYSAYTSSDDNRILIEENSPAIFPNVQPLPLPWNGNGGLSSASTKAPFKPWSPASQKPSWVKDTTARSIWAKAATTPATPLNDQPPKNWHAQQSVVVNPPRQPAWVQSTTTARPAPIQAKWNVNFNVDQNGGGENNIESRTKLDKSQWSASQTAPSNIYLISDQFRITANTDAERGAYMDQIDNAWQNAIGNTTEFVQLVLYRDDTLPAPNSLTHELGYVVVIVSSNANLDLIPFKTNFDRLKPRAPLSLTTTIAEMVPSPYAFLVLRDSIPRSYSSVVERDAFMGKLQQLYVDALGKDALSVALGIYDDDQLDRMLDGTAQNTIKDLHQLSYFVLIVSGHILDEEDTQHRFQQYLINRAVNCLA